MAQHSSQLSQRDSSKSLFNRRHYLFFALLAITTPFFLQAVAGASVHTNVTTNSIASTGEALELLTRPHSYHGVVHTASSGRNKVRQELSEQPAGKVKNKMNGDLYPVKDSIPDVNHPQVKAWVAEIDWSKVPKIPVAPGLADAPHFPKCPPDSQVDKSSCWWSCGGCVQPSDIMTCPNTLDWGLTYDDGPSEATKDMMTHLNSKNLKATFFIVGSRVLEYPEILKEEVAQGHHIAMH
ncbi:chitin deacetylase, partial [Mortierella claussenii]